MQKNGLYSQEKNNIYFILWGNLYSKYNMGPVKTLLFCIAKIRREVKKKHIDLADLYAQ